MSRQLIIGGRRFWWKKVCFLILCASSGLAQTVSSDPWQSLRFLIGTWDARTQGGSAGASGSGSYTFQLELRDHVLARHSSGANCKGPADFDCEHGDLLYVYQDAPRQPYKAIYFDNEGHVMHYDVSIPSPTSVVFLSGQFRLSYELRGSTMYGKFQMRAPAQAEFKSYLEWSGARKK
jgi:hypothetical protein